VNNFADVLKGIGLLIVHTAEAAAQDPAVQQAIVTMVVTAVKQQAAAKS